MKVCNARLQYRPWRRCRLAPCKGKKRCKFHGGRLRGPRPRYDENGNYIVLNLEARNAGYRRWVERRRLIREAMKACEPPKPVKPKPKSYEAMLAGHARWLEQRKAAKAAQLSSSSSA